MTFIFEKPGCGARQPSRARSFHGAQGPVRRGLLPLIVVMLVLVGDVAGADFDEEDPESPREVLRNRRLEGIYDRITIELAHADGNLAGAEIDVEVAPGGKVTLLGVVASEAASARAEHLAKTQVGVKSVQNRLRVDPTRFPEQAKSRPSESARPEPAIAASDGGGSEEARVAADAELSRAVANELAEALPFDARAERAGARGWHVDGRGWRFDVVARDGNVWLVGDVESVDAVTRAAGAVARRPDVASVELELEPADEGGWFDWLGF